MSSIFLPVVGQILLTISLYILLNIRKSRASKEGRVDENRRGLYDDAWPEEVVTVNNCIRNQFEIPVLFYVLCLIASAQQTVGYLVLATAWLFLLSRVGHAAVQTTTNHVPTRRLFFIAGLVALLFLLTIIVADLLV